MFNFDTDTIFHTPECTLDHRLFQKNSKGLHNNSEKIWGQGISLSQPSLRLEESDGGPVDKDGNHGVTDAGLNPQDPGFNKPKK